MKHLFSFSLMLVLLLPATAHDFEVDGIYYNQFYNNEAEVTYLGTDYWSYSDRYQGEWFDNQPDGLVYAGLVAYKYNGTMPENTHLTI